MSDEFISYEDAQKELSVDKDELNDKVAKGELRAFRDGDEVRFKREDIVALKKSRETEPTIVLSDTEADRLSGGEEEEPIDLDSISTDDTVLNIEGLLEDESEGTTPIPGAENLEEVQVGAVGEDTVLDTEGIDLDEDFELSEDDTLLEGDEEETLVAGAGPRSIQMARKESHGWLTVTLAVTVLVLLGPAAVLLNLMVGPGVFPDWISEGFLSTLNGAVEGIIGLF